MTTPPIAAVGSFDINRQRTAVLGSASWFPSPLPDIVSAPGDTLVADLAATLTGSLLCDGIALCLLPEPLSCMDFVALAAHFGEPEPERDPTVAHRVQDRVVLNLKPDTTGSVTELTQPFSDSALTFHVEGSRRPPGTTPAYLLFQCMQAPEAACGGQTILRSIPEVLGALSAQTVEILAQTIMYPNSTTSTVVGLAGDRMTLNFRDPSPDEVRWQSPRSNATVAQAMNELQSQIYRSDRVFGVPWSNHLITVIDNRRWLHGRTAGCSPNRHLQRIRVQAPSTTAGASS